MHEQVLQKPRPNGKDRRTDRKERRLTGQEVAVVLCTNSKGLIYMAAYIEWGSLGFTPSLLGIVPWHS